MRCFLNWLPDVIPIHLFQVNHVPGASRFTSKVELAKESRNLALVPQSFVLPDQYEEFMQYHHSQPEGTTWVQKGTMHRGVEVIDPSDESLRNVESEMLIQQFVRPYLIDGCVWPHEYYSSWSFIQSCAGKAA